MSAESRKKPAQELPFEKALERLEAIVEAMESGELPLDRMMTHVEEGHALIRQCSRQLEAVERKLETLVRRGDDIVAEPLDPEPSDA